MKTNPLSVFALLAALSLTAPASFALTAAQTKAVQKALASVPVPEVPAKAAELVSKAPKEDQEQVAVVAVRAAIYKNRSSAAPVVAAISKAAPHVAPSAASAASQLEEGQTPAIAAAANYAAPAFKPQVMSAIYNPVSKPAPITALQASSSVSIMGGNGHGNSGNGNGNSGLGNGNSGGNGNRSGRGGGLVDFLNANSGHGLGNDSEDRRGRGLHLGWGNDGQDQTPGNSSNGHDGPGRRPHPEHPPHPDHPIDYSMPRHHH